MQHLAKRARLIHGIGAALKKRISLRILRTGWSWWLGLATAVFPAAAGALQSFSNSNELSIAELLSTVSEHGSTIRSFRIEGVVCAVAPERKLIALQDSSATVLLELPSIDLAIRAGEWLAVEGKNCSLARSDFGIQLGTAPVVNDDGHHPAIVKSGRVFLEAGLQPIRVTWFNGKGPSALKVEYEGPGIPRQKIPGAALWRKPIGATNQSGFRKGVAFAAYTGNWRYTLPDFAQLSPVAEGVATNFELTYSVRQENTALAFSGYVEIPRTGVYTFYLESDDGAYLYAGDPAAVCKTIVLERQSAPVTTSFEQALAGRHNHQWTELEGEVTFAGQTDNGLEVELAGRGNRVPATIVDGSSLFCTNLLHRHVRVFGICEVAPDLQQKNTARIIVPGSGQVEVQEALGEGARDFSRDTVLTAVEQVRHLKREEAAKGIRARITGVATWTCPRALVLQDATGGVYIHYYSGDWTDQPCVGELWEIEGTTDRGDFSPVIRAQKAKFLGKAALPEPIRPTWDQLMNGSLDAEYVEIRGVLTAISGGEMTILTPAGKIKIERIDDHPLPRLPAPPPDGRSYVDSVVRIRGCLTAEWDNQTRQVMAGEIILSPGTMEIEELSPLDPFSVPTKRAADLLLFDPGASALQETKVKGQIIYARPGEYCLLDGQTGLRLLTKRPLPLQTGDLVEAVGFPQLGGPSPVLQEAQARKIGSAPLPAPVQLPADELPNRNHDSTLVQVEAMLRNDRLNREERVLELQAGPQHFIARLESAQRTTKRLLPESRLQVTGVYSSARSDQADASLDSFELLLNSAAGIRILQQPSWWTVRRAVTLAATLAGALGIALIWITLLRRKVEERTAQLTREVEERQRVEQHRVMEQERARVAQDLHDELGAGLTEVGILGALAKNPSIPAEKKERYLDQLTNAARFLVTALDEIVWAVNPHYDSVGSLASYYSLFAQRFLNLAGIACRLQVAELFPEYPLDSRLRHGIFLAFKEALNNVVRHSGATEVQLTIEVARDELMISLADNGRGFEANGGSPGSDGLASMQQRLRKLDGDCQVSSRPGRGTTVEFRLPLNGISHDQDRHCRR